MVKWWRSFTDNFPFCRVISLLEIASNWTVWRCQWLSCVCDFYQDKKKKWHNKFQTPRWDYKTQEHTVGEMVGPKHSAGPTYCASDNKKLLCLLPLWDVGVDSLTRWEPLHKQWTRLQALEPRRAVLGELVYGHATTKLSHYLNVERSMATKKSKFTHFQTIEGETIQVLSKE